MVMGGDSSSKGRGFKSRRRIVDGHYIHDSIQHRGSNLRPLGLESLPIYTAPRLSPKYALFFYSHFYSGPNPIDFLVLNLMLSYFLKQSDWILKFSTNQNASKLAKLKN